MSPKLTPQSATGKRGRVNIDVDEVHPYRCQERCDVVDRHPAILNRSGQDVIVRDHHLANSAAGLLGREKQSSLLKAHHDGAIRAGGAAVKVGSSYIGSKDG